MTGPGVSPLTAGKRDGRTAAGRYNNVCGKPQFGIGTTSLEMLKRISLHGFKSIKALDLKLGPLNVLIGANGAGKSNFISFFKLLNEMMGGRLQQYVAQSGYASSLLHFGPKTTPQMSAEVQFESETGANTYSLRLFHAAGDTLIFADETLSFQRSGTPWPQEIHLGAGHQETKIGIEADNGNATARVIRYLLNKCRVYHFHDTSPAARVRQRCFVGDSLWLAADAGNLAAVLLRLKMEEPQGAFRRIGDTIRLLAPYFEDFELEPSGQHAAVNWRSVGSDQLFGPHQLSDGTLRAMCLATLLLLPQVELPRLVIVDEPELGLHPYALNVIASLVKMAATRTQVLVSTQSSAFLDHFEPEDIIVADRDGNESRLSRPDPVKLAE